MNKNRDLLTLFDLTGTECLSIIERAKKFKEEEAKGSFSEPLKGKTLGMIFSKNSTRTRLSFEVGMHQLGGDAIFNHGDDLQLGHGESVAASAKVFSLYLDAILVRTYEQEDLEQLAKYSSIPVINGLTDSYHPCQILADIYTLKEECGAIQGKQICYIGDGNNICNSLMNGAALTGFDLVVCTPEKYAPDRKISEYAEQKMIENFGENRIRFSHSPKEAVEGANIVYTDTWVSMGMEEEKQQRLKDFQGFQVNKELLSLCKQEGLVMHCLPAHEGEEITVDVLESFRSIVYRQAKNRLFVQKAILEFLLA